MMHHDIETLLIEKGIKSTANRILVAKALLGLTHPVSLADLEIELSPMDKASIFRVLELFAEKEIVHIIEDGSRSVKYELCHGRHAHSVEDQHVHFYCESCRQTLCLEDYRIPEISLPEGFKAKSVNFVIKGICPKCDK